MPFEGTAVGYMYGSFMADQVGFERLDSMVQPANFSGGNGDFGWKQ